MTEDERPIVGNEAAVVVVDVDVMLLLLVSEVIGGEAVAGVTVLRGLIGEAVAAASVFTNAEDMAAAAAAALNASIDGNPLVEDEMSDATDFRPLLLPTSRLFMEFTELMELDGEAADAAEAAEATREVDRSSGDSSRTLSIRRLNSVCRKYWMAGRRNASSGLSGTKKATNSVLGPTSLMRSNIGSPVGPFRPTTLTSSL